MAIGTTIVKGKVNIKLIIRFNLVVLVWQDHYFCSHEVVTDPIDISYMMSMADPIWWHDLEAGIPTKDYSWKQKYSTPWCFPIVSYGKQDVQNLVLR